MKEGARLRSETEDWRTDRRLRQSALRVIMASAKRYFLEWPIDVICLASCTRTFASLSTLISRHTERNCLRAAQTLLPQEWRTVLEALPLHEVRVLVQRKRQFGSSERQTGFGG